MCFRCCKRVSFELFSGIESAGMFRPNNLHHRRILAVRLLLPFILLCASSAAWSRGTPNTIGPYMHDSWRTEDGLAQNSAQAIIQTSDGYLWVGTQEGLQRFDGAQFKTFDKKNTSAFKLNDVRTLLQDREGNLWIGTFGSGVIRYKDNGFHTYLHEDGLSNNTVAALLQDRDGNLWIGTDDGLNELKQGRFVCFGKDQGLSDSKINVLAQSANGDLWVGTNNGLNRIPHGNFQNSSVEKLLTGSVIKSLLIDSRGDLWIGTQTKGLYRLPRGDRASQLVHYGAESALPQASIRAILQDDDTLWAGTDGGGVCRLEQSADSKKFECYTSRDGLSGNSVDSLFRDREGNLWIGTETGGLNRLRPSVLTIFAGGADPDDAARSIFEGHDGSIWIAMDSGLRRYKNGEVKSYPFRNGMANSIPWSVIEDREGNIWLGTKGGGLNEFTKGGVKNYTTRDGLADDAIYAVFQDHTGDIWVGTPHGLSRFHQGRFTTYDTSNGLSGKRVWFIFEDHAQNLWLGTDAGLTLFSKGHFSNFDFDQPGSISDLGGVTYIYEDSDHVLWIGTDGIGLKRFANGNFTTYRQSNGLFDDTIWAILEDDQGNLWMSSNRGISRVSKSELNDFSAGKLLKINSVSYGSTDGMPASECNGDSQMPAWKTRDGKLLFACVRAVVAVNARNQTYNPLPPPVVIEEVDVNDKHIADNERVPVGRGDLKFDFAALSYVAPEKVEFKYRLEGSDYEQWTDAKNVREVPYTNIPPGEYTFQVIASNNDGVWNQQGASFHFFLKPRFYQTTWFKVACVVCVLSMVIVAYRLRILQARRREKELTVLVAARTRALQLEMAQRQEIEEALRRTAAIVESAYDAIWSVDRDATILTWNKGAEELFGYSAEEAIGKHTLIIFPSDRVWELDHYFDRLLNGECLTDLETVRRNKDGVLLDVSMSLSPIFKDGVVTGVSLIARDITERKRAEEALQHAKDAAEAATHAKSEFLANMSHEIRTPLNGVIGMVELAQDTELNPEQSELLKMANDSAGTLLVLINDILDFSKIEAGKLELDSADFDLAETVSDTLRSMALRAHEKRLELACYISPALPESFLGDALRLKQVLTNLLGNAIKFTHCGEVVLRVEPGTSGLPDEVVFSISDTGIGIPLEKQRSIFEAFSQADASTTRRFGGTGLGLAISSRIVSLMGGTMWVESELGKGSTFHFTAKFKPAITITPPGAPARSLKGVPILIVDDNLTSARILAQTAAAWGMIAITAQSGPAALEKLITGAASDLPFAVLLLDSQMPDMDGFALLEQVSQHKEISVRPIMMLTSDAYHSMALRCRQAGITEHLLKPVRPSELLLTLETVLGKGAVPKTPAKAGSPELAKSAKFRILVVEDNLVNQKLVVRVLEKAGHQTAVAVTGRKALEILGEQSFDLVLMDLQMPEMDGFDTTATIREREQATGRHIPIIAMTAHAMKGDRERCLEKGMDEYIPKPIDANALLEVIAQVMSAAGVQAKARSHSHAIQ
jgi:PAS domain S-box-containing protein